MTGSGVLLQYKRRRGLRVPIKDKGYQYKQHYQDGKQEFYSLHLSAHLQAGYNYKYIVY